MKDKIVLEYSGDIKDVIFILIDKCKALAGSLDDSVGFKVKGTFIEVQKDDSIEKIIKDVLTAFENSVSFTHRNKEETISDILNKNRRSPFESHPPYDITKPPYIMYCDNKTSHNMPC